MTGLTHSSTQPNGTYVLLSFSLAISAINTAVFLRGSVDPFTYSSAIHVLPLSPSTTLLLLIPPPRSPKPSNFSSRQPLTHFHLLYCTLTLPWSPNFPTRSSLFHQDCLLLLIHLKPPPVSSTTTKLLRQTFPPLLTTVFFLFLCNSLLLNSEFTSPLTSTTLFHHSLLPSCTKDISFHYKLSSKLKPFPSPLSHIF